MFFVLILNAREVRRRDIDDKTEIVDLYIELSRTKFDVRFDDVGIFLSEIEFKERTYGTRERGNIFSISR